MTECACGCGGETSGKPGVKYLHGHNARKHQPVYHMEDRGYETSCWVWDGRKDHKGYGKLYDQGKVVFAHVKNYRETIGEIPDGLELDHLCRQRDCVNPHHLEPVTHQENCRRGNNGINSSTKTHCPQGHPYDEANTYHPPGGRAHRTCRICRRNASNKYSRKHRSGAAQ